MKNSILISCLVFCLLSCSQETIKTAYHGETDPVVIADFNQTVGQSEQGFSKSYRATNPSFKDVDPLFEDAQQLFRQYNGTKWLELSRALRDKISPLSARQLSMEIQLLSLKMIVRYLLPLNGFSSPQQEEAFYSELEFYLQQLVEQKGIDLDVMTDGVLRLDGHASTDFLARAKAHILEVAAKDKTTASAKLKDLENSSDPMNYDMVSKRYYEQVLKEAEYAIATLGQ